MQRVSLSDDNDSDEDEFFDAISDFGDMAQKNEVFGQILASTFRKIAEGKINFNITNVAPAGGKEYTFTTDCGVSGFDSNYVLVGNIHSLSSVNFRDIKGSCIVGGVWAERADGQWVRGFKETTKKDLTGLVDVQNLNQQKINTVRRILEEKIVSYCVAHNLFGFK